MSNKSKINSVQELVNKIISHEELSEYAFGGYCFSMAVALHRFYPESSIIVAFNKAIYEHKGTYIGHCAIEVEGHIIDGDGVIEKDTFLSWGMLADDDYSYISGTKISKSSWKQLAYESEQKTIFENELNEYIDQSVVEKILSILNS